MFGALARNQRDQSTRMIHGALDRFGDEGVASSCTDPTVDPLHARKTFRFDRGDFLSPLKAREPW